MLSGIYGLNQSFLAGLNQIENRISQANQQITSGVRVSQASDDPSAVGTILDYQQQIDQITQVQTNLNTVSANVAAADGALQTASQLLDQLTSIAAQGASSTSTSNTSANLAVQAQAIQQQLVSLANTSVAGHYVFGGDDPTTPPYTYTGTGWGVSPNFTTPTLSNTSTVTDANGQSIVPIQSAQQIFDSPSTTAPTTTNPTPSAPPAGNIFAAAGYLRIALQNNDQASVQTAAGLIKSAVAQLGQATLAIGDTETWIQQANSSATQMLTNIQQALSTVRDADIPTEATQLTMDETALQAALSAHASFNNKSLFDYLG
jgi:flagellar hook-associated protein 3 FlgL